MISIPHFLALIAACALLTHLLMPLVRRLGMSLGLVDHPSWRRSQREAVPCSGGLAIYASVVLTALALALLVDLPFSGHSFAALGLAGLGTLVLGVLDDRVGLHAEKKLLGQVAVVMLPMASGLTLHQISLPGLGTVELGLLGGPITLFWYLGFINSMNLIDGLDGLASGIGVIVLAGMGMALYPGDPVGMLFVGALLGGVLGFLRSNLSRSRIFLGDAGSMLLGLWLAGLAIGLSKSTPTLPLTAVIAMAVPILDTTTTIFRRRRRGVSIFRADDEHLHHRLLRLGMSPRRATTALWFASVAFASLALVVDGSANGSILALAALAATAVQVAYTLPRTGRPTAKEAIGYLLGAREYLVSEVSRRQLAEIIEMPRYSQQAWPRPTEAKSEKLATAELLAAEAKEGGGSRDDVVLALGEENH